MQAAGCLAAALIAIAGSGAQDAGEGPVRATDTPLLLEVPFLCGAKVPVSQAHGTFSHTGSDRWAWDFRVPEGTPVLAAAAGVVRLARGDSTRGGCNRRFGPHANHVIVTHSGGVETQYLHFSKVFVSQGERVVAGTILGEVGRTGFSCGSHLHFQLQRAAEAWAGQSVPALFRELGDPLAEDMVVSRNCAGPSPRTLEAAAPAPASSHAAGGSAPQQGLQ